MTGKTRAEISILGDNVLAPQEMVSELGNWALIANAIEINMNLAPDESLLWKIHFSVSTQKKRQVNAWSEIHLLKAGQDPVILTHIFISGHQTEPGNMEDYVRFLVTALRRRQTDATTLVATK